MKAPDKIYVAADSEFGFKNTKTAIAFSFEQKFDTVEYIRKDALLEWLQKEYETNKWFYDTHAKPNNLHSGRCEAYKQVINKIESL